MLGYKESKGRTVIWDAPKKSLLRQGFTPLTKKGQRIPGGRIISLQGTKRKTVRAQIVPEQWKDFFHMGGL